MTTVRLKHLIIAKKQLLIILLLNEILIKCCFGPNILQNIFGVSQEKENDWEDRNVILKCCKPDLNS